MDGHVLQRNFHEQRTLQREWEVQGPFKPAPMPGRNFDVLGPRHLCTSATVYTLASGKNHVTAPRARTPPLSTGNGGGSNACHKLKAAVQFAGRHHKRSPAIPRTETEPSAIPGLRTRTAQFRASVAPTTRVIARLCNGIQGGPVEVG